MSMSNITSVEIRPGSNSEERKRKHVVQYREAHAVKSPRLENIERNSPRTRSPEEFERPAIETGGPRTLYNQKQPSAEAGTSPEDEEAVKSITEKEGSPMMDARVHNHYSNEKAEEMAQLGTREVDYTVIVKKEPNTEKCPVQLVSVQDNDTSQRAQEKKDHDSSNSNNSGGTEEVGENYVKFLLFAGRLYCCAKISCFSQNMTRLTPDNTQGRKGKVVVLLLFHKTFREVMSYVVGVVEHTASKDQKIAIKTIKSQSCTTTVPPQKLTNFREVKFGIGSKKLLCNLQCLAGPVYDELVKILDGFGANSTVDLAKISEFNAMINANADRFDRHMTEYPSLPCSTAARYATPYNQLATNHPDKHRIRHSPVGQRLRDRYSPTQGIHERPRSEHAIYPLQQRAPGKTNQSYTVQSNHSQLSPRHYNGHEHHYVNAARSVSSGLVYHPERSGTKSQQDGEISPQRRNVADLQTVAELCKEKMKRDMAEQELKTIKAAFEEFKSQMQHHLSQVEERMVLLEAENRSLKGKLSNIHQSNGYAEKKYHELKSRLEEVLKSV